MTKPDEDQLMLDTFFAAGRAAAPEPSDALMARIMADAAAVQAAAATPAPAETTRGRDRFGLLGAFMAALGGWPAMAGLASAAVAGIWIGAAQPDVAMYVGLSETESSLYGDSGYDLSDIGQSSFVLAGDF